MCPWLKRAPLTLRPLRGLGEVGRGTQGVFAGDKSDFQKIIRQEVQSDAVLSHLLLPPCEYNPGPVPRPHGHLRVMKSSQLRLQPGLTAQGTSWPVSHPPQAGNVRSLQRKRRPERMWSTSRSRKPHIVGAARRNRFTPSDRAATVWEPVSSLWDA